MRREIILTLVGFLGGFAVAAGIFWQSSPQPAPDDSGVVTEKAKTTQAGGSSSGGSRLVDRARRPVVVSSPGEEGRVEQAAPGVQKAPAELMHEALASLNGMKAEQRQAAANDLISKLKQHGPAGLQAARDFLRAGQDVQFQGGYAMMNGKMTMAPSLRYAMVGALADWPGNEDLHVTRDLLGSTSKLSEAGLLIRQMEAKSPGTYKAEAIQTLQKLAALPQQPQNGFYDGGATIFDGLRYFKAPELIPAAEQLVQKNGWAGLQYLQALGDLPQGVRGDAVERLFANADFVKQITSSPYTLQGISYTDPVISAKVAQLFSGMERKAKEQFLMSVATAQPVYVRTGFLDDGSGFKAPDAATQMTQLKARLALVNQIAPQANTPVLQERLQDARDSLQKAIANPPAVQTRGSWGGIGGGAGMIQVSGDSSTVIVGGGALQVSPAPGK